jgi:hypothetical protein
VGRPQSLQIAHALQRLEAAAAGQHGAGHGNPKPFMITVASSSVPGSIRKRSTISVRTTTRQCSSSMIDTMTAAYGEAPERRSQRSTEPGPAAGES